MFLEETNLQFVGDDRSLNAWRLIFLVLAVRHGLTIRDLGVNGQVEGGSIGLIQSLHPPCVAETKPPYNIDFAQSRLHQPLLKPQLVGTRTTQETQTHTLILMSLTRLRI